SQPVSLAPLEPVSGPVLGGNLIGVGGKVKQPSVVVYQGGKSDYQWEFIWNPLTGALAQVPGAGVPGAAPGTGGAQGTQTSPFAPPSPRGAPGGGLTSPGAPMGLPPLGTPSR